MSLTAADAELIPTRNAAAALLGISPRVLSMWTKEPWFPADAVGKDAKGNNRNWNVTAIRAARDAQGRKGSDTSDLAKQLKLANDNEKLKQAKLETEKRELQNAVLRGDLIPRAAVELFAATLLTELADWIGQVPDLAEQAVPKKYRKKLVIHLTQALDKKRRQTALRLAQHARDLDAENQTRKSSPPQGAATDG